LWGERSSFFALCWHEAELSSSGVLVGLACGTGSRTALVRLWTLRSDHVILPQGTDFGWAVAEFLEDRFSILSEGRNRIEARRAVR